MAPAIIHLVRVTVGQPEINVTTLCQELGLIHQTLHQHASRRGGKWERESCCPEDSSTDEKGRRRKRQLGNTATASTSKSMSSNARRGTPTTVQVGLGASPHVTASSAPYASSLSAELSTM